MKIYYAHHLWKYGTPIEDYEIECIKKKFEDAEIINPRTLLPQDKPESEIMQLAYDTIKGNTCYEMKDVDLKDIVFQGDNRVYALVRIPYEYQEDTDW